MERPDDTTLFVARSGARFVFVTMLLDWLVVGILAPVMPKSILKFNTNASAIMIGEKAADLIRGAYASERHAAAA